MYQFKLLSDLQLDGLEEKLNEKVNELCTAFAENSVQIIDCSVFTYEKQGLTHFGCKIAYKVL